MPHVPRVLLDEPIYCETAGIPPEALETRLSRACQPDVVMWVRKSKRHAQNGCYGLVLLGYQDPEEQCIAIAGTMVRNFIDARVRTVEQLASTEDGYPFTCSVLLVPNVEHVHKFQQPKLASLLSERILNQRLTILAMPDRSALDALPGCERMWNRYYVSEGTR